MCRPGESEIRFTGKLIASLTTCQSTSSGTSGVAKGFAMRKQTSVNGSRRNSSSSSGEWRAISTGMYSPPSGASPRRTAPRSDVRGASRDVLRYLKSSSSSRAFDLALNHLQKRGGIQRTIAQRGDLQGAVRKCLVTLAARGDQRWIAARNGFARRFLGLWLKRAAPQYRFGIGQISFDQELLLSRRGREIDNGHLPPQAHQQIVSSVDEAPGGIEHQGFFTVLLKLRQDFVEGVNFLRQVVGFALPIGEAVRPAHPRGHTVDSGEPAGGEARCKLLLDAAVAGNCGNAT